MSQKLTKLSKRELRDLRIEETFIFLHSYNIPYIRVNGDIELHINFNGKKYKLFPSTQRWCEFGYHVNDGLDSFKLELNL